MLRCGVVYFLLDVCLRITFCCGLGLVGLFADCGIWVLLFCLFVLVLVVVFAWFGLVFVVVFVWLCWLCDWFLWLFMVVITWLLVWVGGGVGLGFGLWFGFVGCGDLG